MKHKKPIPTGSRIIRNGEDVFVSAQIEIKAHIKKTHSFNLTIDNENFLLEKSKEKLVNMLIDLYYNKIFDSEIIDSPVQEQVLTNIHEIMESDHTHSWDYIDKGGYTEADGYILRFVCKLCGLYKRIEERTLKNATNTAIDESLDIQPSKLVPLDDNEQSEAINFTRPSVYD